VGIGILKTVQTNKQAPVCCLLMHICAFGQGRVRPSAEIIVLFKCFTSQGGGERKTDLLQLPKRAVVERSIAPNEANPSLQTAETGNLYTLHVFSLARSNTATTAAAGWPLLASVAVLQERNF